MTTPRDRKKGPEDSDRREQPGQGSGKDRAERDRSEVNDSEVNERVKREEEEQVLDNPGAL